jgi:protein-S-isoprenylcysteine O-methyltransferase Ste14
MSLSEKWINTVFKIATGKPIIRNAMTPAGALIFLSFVTGLLFISVYADKSFELKPFISFPFDLIIGVLFLFSGLSLTGYCVYNFIKSGGTPVPLNPPKKLITDGPYAISRNPMITGLIFLFIGFGFIWNSVTLTFIITPFFIIIKYIELKKIEEPEIEKRFGNDYIEYKKKVPMFIPKLQKKKPE